MDKFQINFRKILLFIICLFAGALISFIILYNPSTLGTISSLSTVLEMRTALLRCGSKGFIITIAVITALLCYVSFLRRKPDLLCIIAAVLFGLVQMVSISFYYFESFIYVWGTSGRVCTYLLATYITYSTLFYATEHIVFSILRKTSDAKGAKNCHSRIFSVKGSA